ncbi:peroxidase [Purpureocillium lavendulum]|uniref:Peroxidase n=1 Tax=Purpureocillium lavendulum TaxID=1247861 RepID=A0AB34G8C3_9HYPO|nr:peroxidase [Purpureocillium lavendulum]
MANGILPFTMRLATGLCTAVLATAGLTTAFPGMDKTMSELQKRQGDLSKSLLGDLETLPDKDLTATGKAVRDILTGKAEGLDLSSQVKRVPPKTSSECAKDKCCIWKYVADEMRDAMVGTAGRCNNFARAAVRLGFHDAGTWARGNVPSGGGADGSIILAGECESRRSNDGLHEICDLVRTWHAKYKEYGVGVADLVQLSAVVGTVACPLGPRVRFFVGRRDSSEPAPEGLLPSPKADADKLIGLFANKTISAAGLVALLGSHTVSQQRFYDKGRALDPQDSTPGVWDNLYFKETLSSKAPPRLVKFASDVNLANDARTRPMFEAYGNSLKGQITWSQAYAREYVRLSLLGVYNINDMTECTRVLPNFMGSFDSVDKAKLDEFAAGELDSARVALMNGDVIPDL